MNPFIRGPQWSREASVELSELPLEGVPDLSWLPSFDDFAGRAAARTAEYQAFAAPDPVVTELLAWSPTFPEMSPAARRATDYQAFAAPDTVITELLAWSPVFPDQVPAAARTAEYQFIAFPVQVTIPITADRAVVIHTPDEIPIGSESRFSVEYDVAGVPVPFDVPPSLRIYHLDLLTGLQVTDLALGAMTQYGVNPAYFRAWTPTAKGVYILEVIGVYLGGAVLAVLPVTVRPKFDPIGLAIDDVLVARNGDVPT